MINFQEYVPLVSMTTFRLGGPARRLATVHTKEELKEAIELARNSNWKTLVLAGGSNFIISDAGFDGLVIKIAIDGLEITDEVLTAGASVDMQELVDASIESSLAGLEWAGGLPGSFGGAIRGNAGCFGAEMKDIVTTVTSINIETGAEVTRNHDDCLFEYRGSYYKYHPEIIISATVQLHHGDKTDLRRIADEHIQYRQDKHPMNYPNCGSIFKNVPLENVPKEHLLLFEDAIKNDPFPIVPTAKILSVAGLKGKRVGDAQLSEKHSNYIINLGNAKSSEVIELIKQIQQDVADKFQIQLEVEPEIVD